MKRIKLWTFSDIFIERKRLQCKQTPSSVCRLHGCKNETKRSAPFVYLLVAAWKEKVGITVGVPTFQQTSAVSLPPPAPMWIRCAHIYLLFILIRFLFIQNNKTKSKNIQRFQDPRLKISLHLSLHSRTVECWVKNNNQTAEKRK